MKFILCVFLFSVLIIAGCKKDKLDIEELERMANEDAVNLFHENKLDYHYDSH
jgi:hypothetical protein